MVAAKRTEELVMSSLLNLFLVIDSTIQPHSAMKMADGATHYQ